MHRLCISEDSPAEDLSGLALCIHRLFGGLPVTARSRNRPGVRVEGDKVISTSYTGLLLELAIVENRAIRERPPSGVYKGIPVVVVPLDAGGEAMAAFGVVDVTGSLDMKALMD